MSGVKKKKKINHANRVVIILTIALISNIALYWLPDSIIGLPIKKVDLLSDIRKVPETDSYLFALLEEDESTLPDKNNATSDSVTQPVSSDFTTLLNSDTAQDTSERAKNQNNESSSPTKTNTSNSESTDYLFNTDIEDFTMERTGLRRFFSALNNIHNMGRPVRIAFVGDSFIEGDILVADFRAKMQEHFGGKGVGFLPITSNVSQYRPTIKQSAKGWKTYSIIRHKDRKYILSGMQFEPESDNASINLQTVNMYPGLDEISSLKFIYSKNENSDLLLTSDTDTTLYNLHPTESITQYEIKSNFTKGALQLKNARGLNAIGIAIENDYGVIVDNFALRGNSGLTMSRLDIETCRELQQIRPYDLIVLQYGLNVASDSVREYGWYRNRMVSVIEHIQECFPGADILVLGVSDRSHRAEGAYKTMPAVISLLRAQRQIAINAEVTFWNTFAAMGGQNSMVKYVNSNWASKDYTHLSFRGGREVANALYDAIINEKNMHDGYE